jgi:hypothetical protein
MQGRGEVMVRRAYSPPTVREITRGVAHNDRGYVRALDRFALEASVATRCAFTGNLKCYPIGDVSRCGISRARNGDHTSPLYRMAGWLVALRRAGADRSTADRLIGWLSDVADQLWETDPRVVSLEELSEEIEAAEIHAARATSYLRALRRAQQQEAA